MPIHEYQCVKCGEVNETLFLSASEVKDELQCICGGEAKRIMSANNFQLKSGGCGWADSGYSGYVQNK